MEIFRTSHLAPLAFLEQMSLSDRSLGLSRCRYGAILEKFQKHDSSLKGRIKGCIVDSAPVAAPDPQVMTALI